MSEPTKGKWLQSSSVLVCDENAMVIANTFTPIDQDCRPTIEEAEANARLIVACCSEQRALRLAEMVMMSRQNVGNPMKNLAREIINKVKGD